MTAALTPLYHVMCSKVISNPLFIKICQRNLSIVKLVSFNKFCSSKILHSYYKPLQQNISKYHLSTSVRLCGVIGPNKVLEKPGLTKQQAEELTLKLTTEERELLLTAIQQYNSKLVKDEYLGEYRLATLCFNVILLK